MWMPGLGCLRGALAAVLLMGMLAAPVAAHPHLWITVEATVLFEHGTFVGVRHKWTFDEFYTAMAIEGLDKNNDGKYDREELAELAKVNIEGLKDFGYFTFPLLAGQELKVGEARDYWLEHKDGTLSLHFTVPFAQPVLMEAKGFTLSIHDPSYFIAFDLAKTDPIRFSQGTPKACKITIGAPGQEPGAAMQQQLGAFAVTGSKTISIGCNSE